MRKPIKIKLADLRQDRLQDLIQITERVFTECGLDFYLLGAIARDAWYSKEDIRSRATKDVDYALYISGEEQYEEVKRKLTTDYKFKVVKRMPFTLHSPFGYSFDLIPFGLISIDDALKPDKLWDRPVFVNGFEEINTAATVYVHSDDGLTFRIATLPAIILLKLIAFDDRPERRTQDPLDIAEIIVNYFDIERELIYEIHYDIFDADLELEEIACVVIGREINDIIALNKKLKERVGRILSLQEKNQQWMIELMVKNDRTLNDIQNWFKLIRKEIL